MLAIIVVLFLGGDQAGASCVDFHGERTVRGQIVNGEASLRPIPYQVALRLEDAIWCGGTILRPLFVLTARHCFMQHHFSEFTVAAGAYTDAQTKFGSQIRKIRALHAPMGGRPNESRAFQHRMQYANDIAILELDQPLDFNDNVGQACLPEDQKDEGYEECTISGWGALDEFTQEHPDVLQKATVSLAPLEDCGYSHKKLLPSMICAGGRNRDACQGDSGGPLVCARTDGKAVVIGITSFGQGCGRSDILGIYTRVSSFLSFINATLNYLERHF